MAEMRTGHLEDALFEAREVACTVNGKLYRAMAEPRRLLSDFIREDLDLKGTHVGCEHGVCGACTILFNGQPARSCLMFAVQADGAEIVTVEGLARSPQQLTRLQESFSQEHALQCGYCTPGMLISATALLSENPSPTDSEVRHAMAGQLCRCTGYEQIVRAVLAAADSDGKGGEGGNHA